MRLAIDALESLAPLVDKLEFVPTATPPHKNAACLLPFAWRAKMIEEVVAPLPNMSCSDIEERRGGVSYTVETLREYGKIYPEERLYFLLGGSDYALLPAWRRGRELPDYADLVVAPRGDFDAATFLSLTRELWPEKMGKISETPFATDGLVVELEGGGRIYYLPAPLLAISSSLIRALWLAGKNIDFLVPARTRDFLEEKRDMVTKYWRENVC